MSWFAALILGVIQGVAEFLPISSSAHLALAHHFFGWNVTDNLTFDVALHFGTLVAILAYFGPEWWRLIKNRDRMLWFVIVASIPGALAGAKFQDAAETTFRSPLQIAILLAIMGIVMAVAERWGKQVLELVQVRWGQAIGIGFSQALAIMPGVSRSGITITTGLAFGLTREAAARFSFLLATPIMLGATLFQCRHLVHGTNTTEWSALVVGILASAITGFASIAFLLRFLRKHSVYPFAIYRLALAAVVVLLVLLMPGA